MFSPIATLSPSIAINRNLNLGSHSWRHTKQRNTNRPLKKSTYHSHVELRYTAGWLSELPLQKQNSIIEGDSSTPEELEETKKIAQNKPKQQQQSPLFHQQQLHVQGLQLSSQIRMQPLLLRLRREMRSTPNKSAWAPVEIWFASAPLAVKVSARLPDWPSACKAGTCSTCRTRTRDIREAATEWGRLVPPRLLTVGDGGNWRFF